MFLYHILEKYIEKYKKSNRNNEYIIKKHDASLAARPKLWLITHQKEHTSVKMNTKLHSKLKLDII